MSEDFNANAGAYRPPRWRRWISATAILVALALLCTAGVLYGLALSQTNADNAALQREAAILKAQGNRNAVNIRQVNELISKRSERNDKRWCLIIGISLHQKPKNRGLSPAQLKRNRAAVIKLGRQFGCKVPGK